MESIGSNLEGNSLLLSQMKSDGAMRKIGGGAAKAESGEGVGNVLESFGGILKEQMANINNLQAQANEAMQTYATGGEIELHNVILAAEKADLSLQLGMQVRNKLIAAYQEVMHMNI